MGHDRRTRRSAGPWSGAMVTLASISSGRASHPEQTPVGRLTEPGEVASVITFLASDRASAVTGVNLPIDGGQAVLA